MAVFENERLSSAILSVASGDMRQLEYIYENYSRLLFSVALSLLGSKEAAEDALHDTFIKLADVAKQYNKKSTGTAKAWLVAVCRNLCLDKLRKEKPTTTDADTYTSDFTEKLDSEQAFYKMLSALNSPDKEIVLFKVAFGFNHNEIAGIVGLTPVATRQRYKRALEKLREVQ